MAELTIDELINILDTKKKEPASDRELDNYFRRETEREIAKTLARSDMARNREKEAAFSALQKMHPDLILQKPTHPDRLIKREILRELRKGSKKYEDAYRATKGAVAGQGSSSKWGKYGALPKEQHKPAVEQFFRRETGAELSEGSEDRRHAYLKSLAAHEKTMRDYHRKRKELMDEYNAELEMYEMEYGED